MRNRLTLFFPVVLLGLTFSLTLPAAKGQKGPPLRQEGQTCDARKVCATGLVCLNGFCRVPVVCGDGVCSSSENCTSCASDCGVCPPPPPVCGDGICNGTETCSSCSKDCGACPPLPPACGDGACNGTETSGSCPGDCGQCPTPTYDDQGCLNNCVKIDPGTGCFVYHDGGDNATRPVRVYYYRSDGFLDPASRPLNSDSRTVFAMHGSERNAITARARFMPYADRYSALILAPEFRNDAGYYPDADDYNRGFVKDGGGNGIVRARSDWTLETIEEIFALVRGLFPTSPSTYGILGNSGGGQFLARLPLLVSDGGWDTVSGSNSGWYTLPRWDRVYPCGIGDLDLTDEDIVRAYSKKVTIGVGELDIYDDYDLSHIDCAEEQGKNRNERAKYYFNWAKEDAAKRGVPFNWNLLEVKGVGHPAEEMAHSSAGAVFMDIFTDPKITLAPIADTYVEENNATTFGNDTEIRIDGDPHRTAYMKFNLAGVQNVRVAVLKVWMNRGSVEKQYVRAVPDNNWSENINWFDAPPSAHLIGLMTGAEVDSWLYIEVTDWVRDNKGGPMSFSIDMDGTDHLSFFSREASTKKPTLLIYE